MQTVLYAGLRNPARDAQIFAALQDREPAEVAELLGVSPSTVRRAAKRMGDLSTFNLRLIGGGEGHQHWRSRRQIIPAGRPWRLPTLLRDIPQP